MNLDFEFHLPICQAHGCQGYFSRTEGFEPGTAKPIIIIEHHTVPATRAHGFAMTHAKLREMTEDQLLAILFDLADHAHQDLGIIPQEPIRIFTN